EDYHMASDPFAVLPKVPTFKLTSRDFADGATLPKANRYNQMGMDGENQSPALEWSGFPAATKSFVVACFDPDAPTGSGFWHWMVVDIPGNVTKLPVGAGASNQKLPGGFHLRTDFGSADYNGAAPPPGHGPHRYIFVVHALGVPSLGVSEQTS